MAKREQIRISVWQMWNKRWDWTVDFKGCKIRHEKMYATKRSALCAAHNWIKSFKDRKVVVDA